MDLITQQLHLQMDQHVICQNLDLHFKPGQCWAILGRNGIGKSTLLHCLAGLSPAKRGEVRLNNQRLDALTAKQLAKQLAIVLQQQQDPFPATVYQTALSARFPYRNYWQQQSATDQAIVLAALKQYDLSHLQQQFTDRLSGGERQRLAIATLMIQQPDFYLLDEPTNHLDLHYQMQVMRDLQNLSRDKAVILVLQDINLAMRFCSHALMIFEQGICLAGERDTLMTEKNLAKLYGHPLQLVTHEQGQYWLATLADNSG